MRPIAIALLSVVGLAAMTVPSNAARCFVTVHITDEAGNPIPGSDRRRPCRPGETNGGVEVYNPFTGAYVFYPFWPPNVDPATGRSAPVPGAYAGSDNSTVHPAATTAGPTCLCALQQQIIGAIAPCRVRAVMKKRRVYQPRVVGGNVMMPADLKRLHKYMLEIEGIDRISGEMRAVVESEWPELAHKLPPKKPQG